MHHHNNSDSSSSMTASRLLLLLSLSLTAATDAVALGHGFGSSGVRCDLRRMLQCVGSAGDAFEQQLQRCERLVCPGGDTSTGAAQAMSSKRVPWEQEDMRSELFIQSDPRTAQDVPVRADRELCTEDQLAAFELSTSITLPFSDCSFDTTTKECTCTAKLPVTGLYVAVDKAHKPRSRRLAYLKGSVRSTTGDNHAAAAHNIWMEGGHRIVLIVLSTIAFIGNFIFLVQVFWVA